MPEIRMPDLTTESLVTQMRTSAAAGAATEAFMDEMEADLNAGQWSSSSSQSNYKPVSFNKAKDGLKLAEKKSQKYRKWPRSWFRNQGRIDSMLFGVVRQLIQLAVKFDAGLRKHDKTLRRILPKVEVLHLSATDLQREFLRLSGRADQMENQLR
ncbi:MAG: hypothetical protein ACAI34_09415, partial [Verrucomicrobium sp.]